MSTIIPIIFNFLAVLAILYFSTRKAFTQFLINRSKEIANAITEAEKLYAEASSQLAQCEADTKNSQDHAKTLFDDAKVTLERIRKTALEKARAEAERVSKEAALTSKTEFARAKLALQRELAEKSLKEAEAYLKGHLNDEDRHGLVSNYVETVGNGHAG